MTQTTHQRCDILATFTETPGSITRTFLVPALHDVHAQLRTWMTALGMSVRIDPIGNIIGHYPGATPDAPVLLIGSHLDTVPNAGKYDGPLGVLLGLSVIEQLAARRLPFAIEVIGFSEEEGVRFATPYFGSRALVGTFDPRWLNLRDRHNIYFDQAMRNFGLDPSRIPDASYANRNVIGYLEAHIEQGPVLESLNLPVGIVTAIAGQSKYVLTFTGRAAHAGTVPMDRRQDALAAAAEFIITVESIAKSESDKQPIRSLVATVGKLSVDHSATNVIPGKVTLTLDLRDADDAIRHRTADTLFSAAQAIAKKRNIRFFIESESHQSAVPMAPKFRDILTTQLQQQGIAPHNLPSGAGHDAAIVSAICPVAMLFLRNPGGISHHPDESVSAEDVTIAEKALLGFVTTLASQYDSPR